MPEYQQVSAINRKLLLVINKAEVCVRVRVRVCVCVCAHAIVRTRVARARVHASLDLEVFAEEDDERSVILIIGINRDDDSHMFDVNLRKSCQFPTFSVCRCVIGAQL